MKAIVPIPPEASLFAELAPDLTRASELARQEKAAATRRAYRSDVRIFEDLVPRPWRQRITGHGRDRRGLPGARRRDRHTAIAAGTPLCGA